MYAYGYQMISLPIFGSTQLQNTCPVMAIMCTALRCRRYTFIPIYPILQTNKLHGLPTQYPHEPVKAVWWVIYFVLFDISKLLNRLWRHTKVDSFINHCIVQYPYKLYISVPWSTDWRYGIVQTKSNLLSECSRKMCFKPLLQGWKDLYPLWDIWSLKQPI